MVRLKMTRWWLEPGGDGLLVETPHRDVKPGGGGNTSPVIKIHSLQIHKDKMVFVAGIVDPEIILLSFISFRKTERVFNRVSITHGYSLIALVQHLVIGCFHLNCVRAIIHAVIL